MKPTDDRRLQAIIRWGCNREIKELGEWAKELAEVGKYYQGARVLRTAEKMQMACKGDLIIVCSAGVLGIRNTIIMEDER